MNRILFLLLALFMLGGANIVDAQRIDYKTDSGFDIGFGIGRSYQQSDVRNSTGSGIDFTFGHSIYEREQSFFSLDWRFRALNGQNKAFDDRINFDSTYNNVNYEHLNLDLELVLGLNQLRNRTGIILTGFLGGGFAYNRTQFDLFDNFSFSETPYDYSLINPFGLNSRRQIYQDLKFLSDGEFETEGINHFSFTPTFGLYLGYQLSKRFSMGIQHKTNLFLGESDDIIGANIDGIINNGSFFDMNHYTTLVFKWDIRKRRVNPIDPPCNKPIVNIRVNESGLTYATHELNGTVTNVSDRADISVSVDGIEDYKFSYFPSTNKITAGFKLSPGTHTITVVANNECGEDVETVTVIVGSPCSLPVISFRINAVNLKYVSHELVGTIANVRNRNDISVKVDGTDDHGFIFNPSTKKISAGYKFTSGTHTIVVTANNECGQDSEVHRVTVNVLCDEPVVNFNVNEINLSYASHELMGTVRNVNYKSDINIKIDGRQVTGFRFNPSTNRIDVSFNLTSGTHNITVSATNECGQDSETQRITLDAPCKLPEIHFNVNEVNMSYGSHELIGSVFHARHKSDISIKIDGRPYSGFNFISSTKTIKANFNLSPGTHRVSVNANNECGQGFESITVVVDAPCYIPKVNFKVNEVNLSYASHELTGSVINVNKKSDISLKLNGRTVTDFRFNPNTKRITANFKLTPGTHSIVVTAMNECGQDSENQRVVLDVPCELPLIDAVVNEVNFSYASHELSGTITNIKYKSDITVELDGRIVNNFQFTPKTRKIRANFKLSSGTHRITIIANNECGQDFEGITVIVNQPCNPPEINFRVNEVSGSSNTHELSGTVTNIKNKSDITMTVDGRPYSGFSFVPGTNKIGATFNFTPGTHTIIIIANNECGRDTETKRVVVNEPCSPPVVSFRVNEVSGSSNTHELSGTITNIKYKSDITVELDGRIVNNFQFTPKTRKIRANFKLSSGTHRITIIANNECGQDFEGITVIVNQPCNPPEINFRVNEVSGSSNTHELSGTVTNIKNKSDITMTVDGRPYSGFSFVPGTNKIGATFNFTPGTHTIIISANNECGRDSETKRVVVNEPCSPPVVSFRVNEVSGSSNTHELNGTVTNVKNKSDITMTVDGRPHNGFSFVPSTKKIHTTFKFTPGTHTIIISANNECGRDSETKRVVVNEPCSPPVVSFRVNEVSGSSNTHELNGTVTNVKNKSDITMTVDGRPHNGFSFVPSTKKIHTTFKFTPGTHTIIISANNECGRDSETKRVVVNEPCSPPVVNFRVSEVSGNSASHELNGTVTNVKNKSDITMTVDGRPHSGFSFVPSTKKIHTTFKFTPGTHTIIIIANNACGRDSETKRVVVNEPCYPPVVNFTLSEVSGSSTSHELNGTVTNVKNKSDITMTVDGRPHSGFSFVPSTKKIHTTFKFTPGTHTIIIIANNECGRDTETKRVTVEEENCGTRINPGNSDWQFCLVTPSGTFNRANLRNNSFTYSGTATSLFFKPIAGGGDAIVNGRPYSLTPGKYYLFTGNITVTVSTKNPGSMGHWSVCIDANRAPQTGTGNSRPKSPCED